MVFGALHAGHSGERHPDGRHLAGTLRTPSPRSGRWPPSCSTPPSRSSSRGPGATWDIDHARGVPAVVNDAAAIGVLSEAGTEVLGVEGLRETEHSMGGDSFAWYLEKVPGAYARLGVHDPASAQRLDLHAGPSTWMSAASATAYGCCAVTATEGTRATRG